MRSLVELIRRITPYEEVHYLYDSDLGYIAWHYTTGDNIEFLFVEAAERGRGHGRQLYRRMCRKIIEEGKEPYHSVIGYRLASNKEAGEFYSKLGFNQVNLGQSIYRGDETVLMWIEWTRLREILGV